MSCLACCGGEDTQRPPDNRGPYPGGYPASNVPLNYICNLVFPKTIIHIQIINLIIQTIIAVADCKIDCQPSGDDAYRTADPTPKGAQPLKMQPIAVPAIPVEEIREVTKAFGDEALIGEGSFGRVYFGVLNNGRSAAIKKLDSSKQPEQEFLAQVCIGSVNELCIFASLSSSIKYISVGH